jgi:hypothetical protein
MIVAIQQPEHLPWIGFFNKMAQCDLYVYLDNVQFKKRYFENRNRIRARVGEQWLTVPVQTKGNYDQKILDVAIQEDPAWKRKYLGALEHNYKKAPYWSDVLAIVHPALDEAGHSLLDLNLSLIESVRRYLGIETKTVLASTLGVDGYAGSDLILEILKIVSATIYVSGPDGRNYLNLEQFTAADINVVFHDFIHPEYNQRFGPFLSNMSVVDCIANCGKEAGRIVRECYKVAA